MGEPILDPGRQAGMCVHDGSEWRKAKGDTDGHAQVDVLSLPDVKAGVRRLALSQGIYNGVPGDTLWHNLVSVAGPGVLVGLDLVSDHPLSRARIKIDGDFIQCPSADVPHVFPGIVLQNLQYSGGESSWYKIGIYDTTKAWYSLFLKREIVYYESLAVDYMAGSATADIGISVQYRGLE